MATCGWAGRGRRKVLVGHTHAHTHYCGDGVTSAYMSTHKIVTLNMCRLLRANYTSMVLRVGAVMVDSFCCLNESPLLPSEFLGAQLMFCSPGGYQKAEINVRAVACGPEQDP